ncbi:carbohydrate ABC transporter permease [Cellulomonas sp. WB94]|uniref:carbohydrate ABC transporter permease n=1 Tax=Cellulomonas sp. WB94 TaxID=2173174 RepID=UPI000D579943|nr:carbohydrate ABC transporter permease [Cellulomonas sp. WB94]PVU83846.1 carbohydrate ABC transporter permease [Cellulomonas sp. WB94]
MTTSQRRRRIDYAIRYLILGIAAAVLVYPFLYMLSTSFKTRSLVLSAPLDLIPSSPTLDNYAQALGANNFGRYFLNSAMVAVVSTALIVALSSMMAYAFSRLAFPGKRILFTAIVVGLAIPTMMLIIPQFLLARDLHLLNSLQGLVPFYVGTALGFNTFLLAGFFETIPRELDEAMIVDGAGPWRRYWSLALPLARPALATTVIFAFLGTWDEFAWALTVLNDTDVRTLPIAISLFQGQHSTSWGLVFAASMIAIVPVLIVYIVFQRFFVAGLTTGAVKG